MLRARSRRTGRKLVDIAAAVVDVHRLPPDHATQKGGVRATRDLA